jgi:hypothetical protein
MAAHSLWVREDRVRLPAARLALPPVCGIAGVRVYTSSGRVPSIHATDTPEGSEMKLIFKVDEEGNGYVAALESANPGDSIAEHRKSANVGPGQEIEVDVADVLSADQIGFGNITDSESGDVVTETPGSTEGQAPADAPGGGNEGSPAAGQDQGQTADPAAHPPEPGTPADQTTDPESPGADAGGGQGGQPPAPSGSGDGAGEQGGGETPTSSAASEKPLYLLEEGKVDGFTNAGFEPSGLETPEGKTLYHYAGDTQGQAATGNADGVNVYADADDNEKPVQSAAPAGGGEGQKTAA